MHMSNSAAPQGGTGLSKTELRTALGAGVPPLSVAWACLGRWRAGPTHGPSPGPLLQTRHIIGMPWACFKSPAALAQRDRGPEMGHPQPTPLPSRAGPRGISPGVEMGLLPPSGACMHTPGLLVQVSFR